MEKHQAKGAGKGKGVHDLPKAPARPPLRPKVNATPFETLQSIFGTLEEAAIDFTVARNRDDAVSIHAVVPGERWEIDVLDDGTVDFERFVSDGEVLDDRALKQSIARFAEPASVD